MGFFQDLKQDLSQTVSDINVDETVDDMSLDASSDELFAEGEDFADLEAMLEKEAAALTGDAPAKKAASEDLFSGIGDNDDEELYDEESEEEFYDEETEEELYDEEPEEEQDAQYEDEADMGEDIDAAYEEENNDISEDDEEMEELLNEMEQNIEEQTLTAEPQASMRFNTEQSVSSSTDTAVITAGMNITGDVTSSGNMDLIGNITGNIEILGKLNVTGSITGNSSAAEIYAESAQINGEIKSKGSVKIGQSSVVIGNIFATSAVIAGAVKGDIDVHGPVILDTSAIVMGNIKSKSVQINNGAVIEGMCSQCYADVSPTSFFNDVKKNRKQM